MNVICVLVYHLSSTQGQGQVSFDLSQSQLGQAVLVSLGQVVLVPLACPSGTSQVQAPPFQSQPLTKFRVISYQKPKES